MLDGIITAAYMCHQYWWSAFFRPRELSYRQSAQMATITLCTILEALIRSTTRKSSISLLQMHPSTRDSSTSQWRAGTRQSGNTGGTLQPLVQKKSACVFEVDFGFCSAFLNKHEWLYILFRIVIHIYRILEFRSFPVEVFKENKIRFVSKSNEDLVCYT